MSISLGTCSASAVDRLISVFDYARLPFELEKWNLEERLFSLLYFINNISELLGFTSGAKILGELFTTRYEIVFPINVIELLKTQNQPFICPGFNWLSCSCSTSLPHNFIQQFKIKSESAAIELIETINNMNEIIENYTILIIFEDYIEQWINFILPEVHTPLIVAYCRNSENLQ